MNISLIKQLRERTSAGIVDCKNALQEAGGDVDAATDLLRKKGIAKAAQRSGRVTSEGLVAAVVKGSEGVLVELKCETDFVARNKKFQSLASAIANQAFAVDDVEQLKTKMLPSGNTIEKEILEHIAMLESIQLSRVGNIKADNGVVASYVHNKMNDHSGKIGVLVALESEGKNEQVISLAKNIAMHVAACAPKALFIEDLEQSIIAKEREIFTEQAKASGKPDSIIDKMVDGKIRKFYQEVVLYEQAFVADNKITIRDLMTEKSKELGFPLKIKSFLRYQLGETL